MLTIEHIEEMLEQAATFNDNVTAQSTRNVSMALNNAKRYAGQPTTAEVRDLWDENLKGVFSVDTFCVVWEAMAAGAGYGDGEAYYESGEPDAITYSQAFEIATFGEQVYS